LIEWGEDMKIYSWGLFFKPDCIIVCSLGVKVRLDAWTRRGNKICCHDSHNLIAKFMNKNKFTYQKEHNNDKNKERESGNSGNKECRKENSY
jgi:hypothetical protein